MASYDFCVFESTSPEKQQYRGEDKPNRMTLKYVLNFIILCVHVLSLGSFGRKPSADWRSLHCRASTVRGTEPRGYVSTCLQSPCCVAAFASVWPGPGVLPARTRGQMGGWWTKGDRPERRAGGRGRKWWTERLPSSARVPLCLLSLTFQCAWASSLAQQRGAGSGAS